MTQLAAKDVLRVGIVGAGGYTGGELLRLVHAHPRLQVAWVGGAGNAGKRLADVQPQTTGVAGIGDLVVQAFEPAQASDVAAQVDVAFSALPHGASAPLCKALLDAGVAHVVDLSADFRITDLPTYEQWYGKHPCPELLAQAVYGLPELHRAELVGARLIAAPGCYPTSAILALSPLLKAGLVERRGIVIDSKSGVSGAGKTPKPSTHLPETAEGLRPYGVAGKHRHVPEIEQELARSAGVESMRVVFTPQLAPMTRGILTIAYALAKDGVTAAACREAARDLYGDGLVTVLDAGRLPDTLWVRGSSRAHVAYELDERTGTVLAMAAIDNLARGASGQAVHALNVALGWPEALGLPQLAQFP